MSLRSPKDLYARLEKGVVDQRVALEQVSISLYKHISGLRVGNIMLIGNSGTGKTTIMRTIERVFAEDPDLAAHTNTIRLNANIVADEESHDLESSIILERLRQNALRILDGAGDPDRFKALVENGVVFLDEVDKIRALVGDKASTRGILAQESLLTLIEGEGVRMSFTRRGEDGALISEELLIDTSRILFICGGAFEGLYDMVYRRVASGEHKDKLVQEYVVDDDKGMEERELFSLEDYVRYEDIFAYGMTPQFLGRFDEIIVLGDLSIEGLKRIFVEPPDSVFREAKRYFQSLGVELRLTREALQLIAEAARENHRLGARALRMVFKRVLRGLEFDPDGTYMLAERDGRKVLTLTADLVRNRS